jgi:CheY-like chemotaxis protein
MEPEPHGCTILVVDDDDDVRATLQEALEAEGHLVLTAREGVEALARMRGLFGRVVALVDLSMPGMDGVALVAAMKADPNTSRIPVVVCTGVRGAKIPGAAAVLEKPFPLERLLDVIDTPTHCRARR